MRNRLIAALIAAFAIAGGIVPAVASAAPSAPVASSSYTWMHG